MELKSLLAEASADTKLLVASNLALSQAILQASYTMQSGTPVSPLEDQVLRSLEHAVEKLNEEVGES